MIGIYCFTNLINNKRYIGQSIVLEQRYNQHLRNVNNEKFQYPIYLAIRKYGLENFRYEILEETTTNKLDEREKYWISYYNSYNNGYNLTEGGKARCRTHCKLTKEDILNIEDILRNTDILLEDISKEYNISIGDVSMINNGKIWADITKNDYPMRNSEKNRVKGSKINTAIFKEDEVLKIRKRYTKETISQIYKDYKDKCSRRAIEKICYGHTFSFLPFYAKREKKWILNGTCIDYPSEEE